MVTAILREASCERGGRAAILVQYDSIFIEIALLVIQTYRPEGAGEQRDRGPRGVLGTWADGYLESSNRSDG